MRFTSASIASLTLVTLATLTRASVIEGLVPRGTPTVSNDVCGCIDYIVVGGSKYNFGAEICTCTSILQELIAASTGTLRTAYNKYGSDNVVRALTNQINSCSDKDKKTCQHPSNSHPQCSRQSLCGYACQSGYKDCNGQCKQSCPTGTVSNPTKRDADYWGHRVQKSCKAGWTACGVSGGGPRDWECVDTHNDLESCGGCPTGIVSSLTGESTGTDCTTIAKVADVACVAGGCAVRKCMPGYTVSASGSSCVEDTSFFRNTLHAAAAYGLEHVPLHN